MNKRIAVLNQKITGSSALTDLSRCLKLIYLHTQNPWRSLDTFSTSAAKKRTRLKQLLTYPSKDNSRINSPY